MKNFKKIALIVSFIILTTNVLVSFAFQDFNLFKPSIVQAQINNQVTIQNNQFSPQTLTIPSGTTITWTNRDSTAHTTTSDNMNAAENWDSGQIATNQTFSKTFNQQGTYSYHCTIHPNMRATIVVTAANTTQPPATELPNTGAPLALIPFIALAPIGWKLIRSGKQNQSQPTINDIWKEHKSKKEVK